MLPLDPPPSTFVNYNSHEDKYPNTSTCLVILIVYFSIGVQIFMLLYGIKSILFCFVLLFQLFQVCLSESPYSFKNLLSLSISLLFSTVMFQAHYVFSLHSSGTNHFSKDPRLNVLENGVWKPRSGDGVAQSSLMLWFMCPARGRLKRLCVHTNLFMHTHTHIDSHMPLLSVCKLRTMNIS